MEQVLPTAVSSEYCSSKQRGSSALTTALMLLCLFTGAVLLLYPAVASYVNDTSFEDAVSHYQQVASSYTEAERADILAQARIYNESLAGVPVRDPFIEGSGSAIPSNYNEVLDPEGTGIMGTVEVPAIGIKLPIYHGTADATLQKGVGHIPQTSFPIGGEGTHAVLTGHTGLPDKAMFTNLVRLSKGDVFVVEVVGESHAYCVDDIRVVEPEDLSGISIEQGKEYVTLLTCTPYGINSHRLLVRGVPCEMPSEDDLQAATRPMPWTTLFLLVVLFVVGAGAFVAIRARRKSLIALERGGCHE